MPKKIARRDRRGRMMAASSSQAEDLERGRRLFFQEVKALASLRHPNIVRVLDFFLANETAYLVMPYERGQEPGGLYPGAQRGPQHHLHPGRLHADPRRPGHAALPLHAAPGREAGEHPPAPRRICRCCSTWGPSTPSARAPAGRSGHHRRLLAGGAVLQDRQRRALDRCLRGRRQHPHLHGGQDPAPGDRPPQQGHAGPGHRSSSVAATRPTCWRRWTGRMAMEPDQAPPGCRRIAGGADRATRVRVPPGCRCPSRSRETRGAGD